MQPDPIRDALYEPPETEAGHARNRLWMTNGLVAAALFLAATNADAVERWAAAQKPNWATETIRLTAGVFAERMAMIGLDEPKLALREWWEGLKQEDWEDAGR